MKIASYLRVSTTSQDLEPQRLELANYAKLRGWEITREYSDVISGAKSSRKGLDALMADVRKGKVKAVMAVKIDRLARSMTHFAQIIGELAAVKCALIISSQNIDTSSSNPAGQLQLNILAAVAAFERDLIRERTNAGLAAAKARGVKLGRPKGPAVHIPITELKAALAAGSSIRQFAASHNLAESTVRRTLKSIQAA